MSQAVMIKSSKNGINLVLHPDLEFAVLLGEITKKFEESEKFFSNAEFAISFEGRDLSDAQKVEIVEAIVSHTKVKILCIIENDEIRDEIIRQKIQQTKAPVPKPQPKGIFYRGSLKAGEQIESEASVIIIGDVPKDASIVSKSSIIVLGTLGGMAYAGMDGDESSFIAALNFMPEKYNIAGIYGEPLIQEKGGIFHRRNKTTEAKIAFANDGFVNVRSIE